jgi:hypothetical protein
MCVAAREVDGGRGEGEAARSVRQPVAQQAASVLRAGLLAATVGIGGVPAECGLHDRVPLRIEVRERLCQGMNTPSSS